MQDREIICYSCGKGMEHLMGRLPCEELTGWFTISHWQGKESVTHYNFCSVDCLRNWVESQTTRIPDVFLQSFGEDQEKGK